MRRLDCLIKCLIRNYNPKKERRKDGMKDSREGSGSGFCFD